MHRQAHPASAVMMKAHSREGHTSGRKALGQSPGCLLLLAERTPSRLQLAAAALTAQLRPPCGLAGEEAFRPNVARSCSCHGLQCLLPARTQGGRGPCMAGTSWQAVPQSFICWPAGATAKGRLGLPPSPGPLSPCKPLQHEESPVGCLHLRPQFRLCRCLTRTCHLHAVR